MRKMIKISAAIFCAGVLLCGIGTGVSIAEYTSLQYTGEHILGAENMKTETMDVSVDLKDGEKIRIWENYRHLLDVRYDETIPEGTIRYVVTYNPDLVKFRTRYEENQPEEDAADEDGQMPSDGPQERYRGSVSLENYYVGNREFDLLMRHKDQILGELKQGKIGSYETRSVEAIEVWMNPEMKKKVDFS